MPWVPITDLNDPRLAIYRALKQTNETRHSGWFVVEGEKLFDRLRASPFAMASALATDRLAPLVADRIPAEVPLYVVPEASIERVVGYNFHRGVLACGVRRPWPAIEDLARTAAPGARFVVCPRLDNPENLGAIVRIADVFGIDAILTGGRCPDPLSRRVLRVSMGSVLRVPVVVTENLAVAIAALRRDHGFTTVATVTDPAADSLEDLRHPGRLALFLGSEGHGLDPNWLALCDRRVTIPMRPEAESLNVAVAAGIALYLISRPDSPNP